MKKSDSAGVIHREKYRWDNCSVATGIGGYRQADGLTHGGRSRCRQRNAICGEWTEQTGCAGGGGGRARAAESTSKVLFHAKSHGARQTAVDCGRCRRRGSHSENLRSSSAGGRLDSRSGEQARGLEAGGRLADQSPYQRQMGCARPRGSKRAIVVPDGVNDESARVLRTHSLDEF